MEWAKAVCVKLETEGYWADYIDPCSGLPVSHSLWGSTACNSMPAMHVDAMGLNHSS